MLEVDARRQRSVLERQDRLDQSRDAGRRVEVPDARFDGAERAEAGVARRPAERARQRLNLDRVAERRPGAVRLDVRDRARIDPRVVVRRRDHVGLPAQTGRREADLQRAVVVDGGALHDGVHVVVVGQRLVEPSQDDDADAVPEHGAGGVPVEDAAVAVRRVDPTWVEAVSGVLRDADVGGARERQLALAVEQCLARERHRDEPCGAGGLHGQARPDQPELVRGSRRQVVLVVAEEKLQRRGELDDARAAIELREVRADRAAGEQPNPTLQRTAGRDPRARALPMRTRGTGAAAGRVVSASRGL